MSELLTLRDLLEHSRAEFGPHTAFQMKREGVYWKYTFNDVYRIACGLAEEFKKRGIASGDRVALLSENRPDWPIAYLAAASMGAVAVPLDAKLTKPEIDNLLKDSGAKLLLVSRELQDSFRFSMPHLLLDEIDKYSGSALPPLEVDPDGLAAIIYTSGTTGAPKGVMLSHWNIMSDVMGVVSLFELGPGDNFLSVLPLHHTFESTAGFMCPFSLGVTVTYAESLKSYHLLANMRETKVSVICGVPLLYNLFLQGIFNEVEEKGPLMKAAFASLKALAKAVPSQLVRRKLFSMIHKKFGGHIRFFVSGGAAIDKETILSFELFGITILQGYGLTETAPILTCNSLSHNRPGAAGRPLPGIGIRLTEQGEVIARGPNIMQGYYKRPDLTAEVLKDEWLHTGDIGTIDDDGYLYITGRIKDVIVSGAGVNVYPDEIEFFINKLPGVLESCVLGVKIREGLKKGMEEVWAVVVPDQKYFDKQKKKPGQQELEQHLRWEIKKLNAKLTEYKRVSNVIIRQAELPKTTTRKVRRFEVRKEEKL
ncbi:MAG TPA: AMP-binding protein [Candidatus Omnitrophota bacterium]|nr:AMP-binding protein [Candidatus Omnitrophota bacterium]